MTLFSIVQISSNDMQYNFSLSCSLVHYWWTAGLRCDDLSQLHRSNPAVCEESPFDGGSGHTDNRQASAGPCRATVFQDCCGPSHDTGWTTPSSPVYRHRYATGMCRHEFTPITQMRCVDIWKSSLRLWLAAEGSEVWWWGWACHWGAAVVSNSSAGQLPPTLLQNSKAQVTSVFSDPVW